MTLFAHAGSTLGHVAALQHLLLRKSVRGIVVSLQIFTRGCTHQVHLARQSALTLLRSHWSLGLALDAEVVVQHGFVAALGQVVVTLEHGHVVQREVLGRQVVSVFGAAGVRVPVRLREGSFEEAARLVLAVAFALRILVCREACYGNRLAHAASARLALSRLTSVHWLVS